MSVTACRVISAKNTFGGKPRQPPRSTDVSGVALRLLPLGFKRQNLPPVAALDLRDIRLIRNRGAPADCIADQSLILVRPRIASASFLPSAELAFLDASAISITAVAFSQDQLVGYSLYFAL